MCHAVMQAGVRVFLSGEGGREGGGEGGRGGGGGGPKCGATIVVADLYAWH